MKDTTGLEKGGRNARQSSLRGGARRTPETTAHRSWNMSRIRSRNTKPELLVRSLLHRMGYRFSLRRRELPGKPDIVLPGRRTVVFVHGCFWHRHTTVWAGRQ